MGDTFSEYLHIAAATIIFASAVAFFLSYTGLLSDLNKTEIEDMNVKTSITMDTQLGYTDPVIYVKGSSVYTDIISQGKDIEISLDGTVLDPDYLENLRDHNSTYLQDLKGRINMDDDYMIIHEYYSTNEIKAVSYSHS